MKFCLGHPHPLFCLKKYPGYFSKFGKRTTPPSGGSGTFLMEHMMTFRKLGLLTTTHPSHRIIIKKVPWYFSNFAKNTLPPPFLIKKVPGVLFEFCQKHPTHPLYLRKKNVLFCKKSVFLQTKDPWYFSKFQKNTYTMKYDGEVHRLIRSFSITYITNFYSEVCIMNMLLSQAI